MTDAVCSKCGESAVEFDEVEGVSACQACGWVLADDQLVHATTFDAQGAPHGSFVHGGDTSNRAVSYSVHASGPGPPTMQRRQRSGGEAKVKGRLREFSALLHLQPAVLEQAIHVLERAIPHLLGSWRRDHLAAAATYAACRLNKLPLTLADVSAVTQLDVFTLGHYYSCLCRLLELQPPLLVAADLLPRSVDRVTAEVVRQGKLAASVAADVHRDAGMLLGWMQRQLERRQLPMANVGAALVLAAEMNTVSLSLQHVSASLPLARTTLERKLAQVRQRLVQLAGFLPYSGITCRNVGSHARTIIQLSAIVGSEAPSEAAGPQGSGSRQQQAASAAAHDAPHLQAEASPPMPPANNRGASPVNVSAAMQERGGGGGGQQPKRARLQAPNGCRHAGLPALQQQRQEPQRAEQEPPQQQEQQQQVHAAGA